MLIFKINKFLCSRGNLFIDFTALLLCAAFIIAGISVSLNRYWQYEVFYYDFGIFDQAIWNVSKFQAPIIDHLVVSGKWIFADHFNPTIFVLSPLYWVTNKSEVILIAQAFIVGFSGVILYKIGLKVLNNNFLSLSILFSYLFFLGLQNAVISDFHEVTISVVLFMMVFLSIVNKKRGSYVIFLLLLLGIKESVFILGIGIGLFIICFYKQWTKIGIYTILVSFLWGFLSIKVIIPYFSGGLYYYSTLIPLNFIEIFNKFLDFDLKRKTLFYSFYSFGFLPLLSPAFWFLIIQDLFIRFIPQAPTRWTMGLHYSAQLASIMAVSSIYGLMILKKILSKYLVIIGGLVIINSFFLYRFILHGPLALSYNSAFYKHTSNFEFLNDLVEKVPKEGSVMAQNNLAVRFSHRKVFFLRDNYEYFKPDYIVLDFRSGQNPNNFFGTNNKDKILNKLMQDRNYILKFQTKGQFLFFRSKNNI